VKSPPARSGFSPIGQRRLAAGLPPRSDSA